MRQLVLVTFMLISISMVARAATEPVARVTVMQRVAGELYVWQRIDLGPQSSASQKASQIRVAIQTRGLSLQGLIRVPSALASNFDTGAGKPSLISSTYWMRREDTRRLFVAGNG
jgi:hypothetical protein